jgi:hypothetical protein
MKNNIKYNIIDATQGNLVGCARNEEEARSICDEAYIRDCTECMIWDMDGNDVTMKIMFPDLEADMQGHDVVICARNHRYTIDVFYTNDTCEFDVVQTNHRSVARDAAFALIDTAGFESLRVWEWEDGEILRSYDRFDVMEGEF